jgi:hypothetical protein
MKDISQELFDKIRSNVFSNQAGKVHNLKGKYVVRDGVTFLVVDVDWKKGKIIVSDTKTNVDNKTTFAIKSFLSKAVVPMEK